MDCERSWVGKGGEIFDRVFPGILFTLTYFQVCQVFPVISGIQYVGCAQNIG